VYLRLLIENGRRPEDIRENATRSLLDGFTSCLFVQGEQRDPTRGSDCNSTLDCKPGQLCNEWNVCNAPPRPYNCGWRIERSGSCRMPGRRRFTRPEASLP
jgi:hypothetical protein